MGAWEGIWLGMQAVDEAKYRQEKLDLQKDQEERLRKAEEANSQLKKIQTLMKTNKDIFSSGSKRTTNLLIKGDLVKDLKNYFNDDFLTPILATNNPEIQSNLLKAVRETHNKLVESGASSKINKDRNGELYAGINILPGGDENLMLENIINRSLQLGITKETWEQYPEIMSKIKRDIKAASLPTANIHTVSVMPFASGAEIKNANELMMLSHNESMEVIKQEVDNINVSRSSNIPIGFKQWIATYKTYLNDVENSTAAKKLAFTGVIEPDTIFAGQENIAENPYIVNLVNKANQLRQGMSIDLIGDKEPGGGVNYNFWGNPAQEAIYKLEDGEWYAGKNNPYKQIRNYFNETGIKLIPEGSIVEVMMRKTVTQGAPGSPMYEYVRQKIRMGY